jgi:hypothetical protein
VAQAVKRSLCWVVVGFDARGLVGQGDDGFLGQTHDRLEEVVIEPQVVVERIEGQGLRDGIETVKSEIARTSEEFCSTNRLSFFRLGRLRDRARPGTVSFQKRTRWALKNSLPLSG